MPAPLANHDTQPRRLLTAAGISRATGFSCYTVNAVKNQKRVPSPFRGKFCTTERFETWLEDNPWFKAVDYYREIAERKSELDKLEKRYPAAVTAP